MWTLLSDLAIIVMERKPIHFTVHVRNVSAKLNVNPLPLFLVKTNVAGARVSSPEKMQLLFTPLILASEPISVL